MTVKRAAALLAGAVLLAGVALLLPPVRTAVADQVILLRDLYVDNETTGEILEVDGSSPKRVVAVAPSFDHDTEITGVSANDHHAQGHDHTGAAGNLGIDVVGTDQLDDGGDSPVVDQCVKVAALTGGPGGGGEFKYDACSGLGVESDPTLTDDNRVTIGDGSSGATDLRWDGDAGVDVDLTWETTPDVLVAHDAADAVDIGLYSIGWLGASGRLQLGAQTASSGTCLSVSTDRIYHDTDCDGTKDAGEEYIDLRGTGAPDTIYSWGLIDPSGAGSGVVVLAQTGPRSATAVAQFIFTGTTNHGTGYTDHFDIYVKTVDSGGGLCTGSPPTNTCDLYDITNGNVLASISWTGVATLGLKQDNTFSNIPTGTSAMAIRLATGNGCITTLEAASWVRF